MLLFFLKKKTYNKCAKINEQKSKWEFIGARRQWSFATNKRILQSLYIFSLYSYCLNTLSYCAMIRYFYLLSSQP